MRGDVQMYVYVCDVYVKRQELIICPRQDYITTRTPIHNLFRPCKETQTHVHHILHLQKNEKACISGSAPARRFLLPLAQQ